jgi:hypothetical protein
MWIGARKKYPIPYYFDKKRLAANDCGNHVDYFRPEKSAALPNEITTSLRRNHVIRKAPASKSRQYAGVKQSESDNLSREGHRQRRGGHRVACTK